MTHQQEISRLQNLFDEQIPLAGAMHVRVANWDGVRLILEAPLAPNLNHHGTAFGGSLYTLGLLAGWGTLMLSLWNAGRTADVVVQHGHADYRVPVNQPLRASCTIADESRWQRFMRRLDRRGRARLDLVSDIGTDESAAFTLELRFVARLLTR